MPSRVHQLSYRTPSSLAVVSTSVTMAPIASLCQTSLSRSRFLVRSNCLPALTGHYLVEILPQPDLLFADEHFAAAGRQSFPWLAQRTLRVAHAPLIRARIAVFQRTNSAPVLSPSKNASEVSTLSEPSLTAAAATASPLPALLEGMTPAQRVLFLRA